MNSMDYAKALLINAYNDVKRLKVAGVFSDYNWLGAEEEADIFSAFKGSITAMCTSILLEQGYSFNLNMKLTNNDKEIEALPVEFLCDAENAMVPDYVRNALSEMFKLLKLSLLIELEDYDFQAVADLYNEICIWFWNKTKIRTSLTSSDAIILKNVFCLVDPLRINTSKNDFLEKTVIESIQSGDLQEEVLMTQDENEIREKLSYLTEEVAKISKGVNNLNIKVDNIENQIRALNNTIACNQDLVHKQLMYADNNEEKEHILKVFTDLCVERIIDSITIENSKALYDNEKRLLIDSMGQGAWEKLQEDSQNFLVSAKVLYAKLLSISNIVDYSGVCLLVTKALELELGKRFCSGYIEYYRRTNPEGSIQNAPLTIISTSGNRFMEPHEFTLGTFQYTIGRRFPRGLNRIQRTQIKNSILLFAQNDIFRTYATNHTDEEIYDLLNGFARDIERVRIDYRNPSAHTNALTRISAQECFNLVLDVEKLLKRMLDSFDW